MLAKPEKILMSYSKVLSDALLVVSQNGPKRHRSIDIDLSNLSGLTYEQIINTTYYSELVETFGELQDPCVYWFEIPKSSNIEAVWNSFHAFKDIGTHRLPRTKKKPPRDTNILYLGKVKFNLLRRMKEHLVSRGQPKLKPCNYAIGLQNWD